jgi:hypothetical protein
LISNEAGEVVYVHPLHHDYDCANTLVIQTRQQRVALPFVDGVALDFGICVVGLQGIIEIYQIAPRPVNVPPTEVANRNPRAVISISVSESFLPIRVPGKTPRYQGVSTTARKSFACF